MKYIIITNNSLVKEYAGEKALLIDTDVLGVLIYSRDLVHKGHKLLSHPLSGSVKPNESPFKSVMLESQADRLDFDSLSILENAIQTVEKLNKDTKIRQWPDKIVEDFKLIDLSLIKSTGIL